MVETEPGVAAFRHPLTRDAIYDDVPWLRRRDPAPQAGRRASRRGHDSAEVAAHWLAARDTPRALDALLDGDRAPRGGARLPRRHAAGAAGARPVAGGRAEGRAGRGVERHARYAELAGELGEAARAQREVVATRRDEGAGRALADAERRIAGIYALQGDRERALAARRVAAEAFAANGLPGEAAAERLVAAGLPAERRAPHRGRRDGAARRRGGAARGAHRPAGPGNGTRGGRDREGRRVRRGVEIIRAGLALALEHELTPEAAEVYQRLGTAHEIPATTAGRATRSAPRSRCARAGQLEQVLPQLHGLRPTRAG